MPTFLCLSSDFGTASHVWLSMDYEFKDQLLTSGGLGGNIEQQSSDISVLMHHLRSLLKMPTHGEFDFESVGWWASLTSLLRQCWYRRLPELETVKLYLKGNDVHKALRCPLLWTLRQMQSYSFSTGKKKKKPTIWVYICVCLWTPIHMYVWACNPESHSPTQYSFPRERGSGNDSCQEASWNDFPCKLWLCNPGGVWWWIPMTQEQF